QVFLVVERELKLTGFWDSIPARNKLKAEIQRVLLSRTFSALPNIVAKRAHIISRIMEIAESMNVIILYAECPMDLDYTIKRSPKRRKLTITVERDRSVVVHAPVGTSAETIEEVVRAKRAWIYEKTRHSQKYQELPHPPGKELGSGEAALYLGRNYRIEVVEDGTTDVQFDHRFLVPRKHAAKRKEVLRHWYVARAKEKILPRVDRHALELGVGFAAAKIVDNRYRWGS